MSSTQVTFDPLSNLCGVITSRVIQQSKFLNEINNPYITFLSPLMMRLAKWAYKFQGVLPLESKVSTTTHLAASKPLKICYNKSSS